MPADQPASVITQGNLLCSDHRYAFKCFPEHKRVVTIYLDFFNGYHGGDVVSQGSGAD